MTHKLIHTLYFSPTQTSKKVCEAIAQGMTQKMHTPINPIDFTHLPQSPIFGEQDVAVISVPVYGGHVAPIALQRMMQIQGNYTPAVLVVVYGNRAFEKAALDLEAFVVERGFVPVAVAAFVGEHSYSTKEHPIAAMRPDDQDLEEARRLGEAIAEKLGSTDCQPVEAARLKDIAMSGEQLQGFVASITARKQAFANQVMLPQTDAEKCLHCGLCVELCPTQAIQEGDELHTDPARCIRCCACVKSCPVEARTLPNPYSEPLSTFFGERKNAVTLL